MLDLIKQYGPAILVLIISYYRDSQIKAENAAKLSELEKKLLENQKSVEEMYAAESDAAVIDAIIKQGGNA